MARSEMTVAIEYEPRVVFEALTDPKILTQWFCERAEVDLDAGRYDFWGMYTIGNPPKARGRRKVLSWERDTQLSFTWRFRNRSTRVHIALAPTDSGTELHLRHDGVPEWRWEDGGSIDNFWAGVLGSNLRGFLRNGDAGLRYDYSYPSRGGCELSVDIDAPRERVWDVVWAEVQRWKQEGEREGYAMELLDLVEGERVGIPQRGGEHEDYTIVTFVLTAPGGRTRLTLVQSGFADPDDFTEAHSQGWTGLLTDLKSRAETGRTSRGAVTTIWTSMPAPDGAAILRKAVLGASDAEIQQFASSLGGYPVLLDMVFKGMCARMDPKKPCVVGFALGDEGGDWTVRVVPGKATVESGIGDVQASVRMTPPDFLRLIVRDPGRPRLDVDGDGSAVARLFSMTAGGGGGRVEMEVTLAAPEADVWAALVEPDQLTQWFAERADVDLDAGRYEFSGRFTPGGGAGQTLADLRPGRLLRYDWPLFGARTSVTLEVAGLPAGTAVRVLHDDVPQRSNGVGMKNFWDQALANLSAWLVLRRPVPMLDLSKDCHGGFELSLDVDAPAARVFALVHEHQALGHAPGERWEIDVGVPIGVQLLRLEPHRTVEMGWTNAGRTSLVTWTLKDSGGRTSMTVVHSGMERTHDATGEMQGWWSSGAMVIKWTAEGLADAVRPVRVRMLQVTTR